MIHTLPKVSLLTAWLLLLCAGAGWAQDGSSRPAEQDKKTNPVQFNGLGRAIMNNTDLGGQLLDTDTTTARRLTDGEFLLDLAINAQPGEDFEVQGILRLRNEFGGFFGAGVTVEIRELWARGVIANTIKYRVGDFDHAMTPYTFFMQDEEGIINEAAVFRPQREVIHYEQFYAEGNQRRVQGAKLDFGLDFPVFLDQMNFSGFIARLRGTDFFTVPSRFTGGGRVDMSTQTLRDSMGLKAKAGFNLAHTWDDLQSGNANQGIRNMVWSVDFDVALLDREKLGVHLRGEAGRSSLAFKADTTQLFDKGDSFLEAGIMVHLKPQKLKLSAAFIDIGPDFFSTAAQSKRVDFDRSKSYFNRIGNDRSLRMPTLFDLSRDRALYTSQLSDRLMAYDPRYANVMPYGQATANRSGLQLGAQYGEADSPIEAEVNAAFLSEIRGQGTFELKSLQQIRASANLNLHKMLDWKKNLRLTLGLQHEQTNRGGQEVEAIDFTSTLAEIGIEAELFSRFDLLLGTRLLYAEGKEYIPLIEQFNEVRDFPSAYVVDDTETLLAAGLRYRFAERTSLTLQLQQFSLGRQATPANNYTVRQVFMLYSMAF